jgi:hypothetical protein
MFYIFAVAAALAIGYIWGSAVAVKTYEEKLSQLAYKKLTRGEFERFAALIKKATH